MANSPIQSSLDTIDTHLQLVTRHLLDPQSGDVLQASTALQAAVLAFSQLAQRFPADLANQPQLKLRLRRMAAALASCRETLLRHTFITQSALSTLMPATREQTYAPAAGRYPRQPYGSAGRQSGEFRVISA